MDDWMRFPVSQLKRLVKSRAGRVAELQMEIKILEGIMEKKVREGDLGGTVPEPSGEKTKGTERHVRQAVIGAPADEGSASPEGPATPGGSSPEGERPPEDKPEDKAEQSKITTKSSGHAFQEID